MWDVITYPFQNFNSGTDDVLEWISNFTHKVCDVITYLLQNLNSGTVLEWINNFTHNSLDM